MIDDTLISVTNYHQQQQKKVLITFQTNLSGLADGC